MIAVVAGVAAGLGVIGLIQALAAAGFVAAFARKARHARLAPKAAPTVFPWAASLTAEQAAPVSSTQAGCSVTIASARPPITVLKPLHGAEPLLLEALATLCRQDYPDWQIVFGVQDAGDTAVPTVRQLQARFPAADITLVVDPTMHGVNRKVGNLINMLPAARHDILAIADSDVHVRPDYLDHLIAALHRPGVGLVTTLYAGLPSTPDVHTQAHWPTLPGRLGATQITYGFLPGAVLARALGRQDCLGATMVLRRQDLERIGGLQTLVHHLADDNVLGRRIAALGLRVALADTVPLTTVPENTLRALFRHELRWARTIRMLEPAGYLASVLQYPLAWVLLAVALTGGAPWSLGLFFAAWVARAAAARWVDHALAPLWSEPPFKTGPPSETEPHAWSEPTFVSQPSASTEPSALTNPPVGHDLAALAFSCPVWLLPLRDILSVAVMLTSYGSRQVDWRGHGLRADTPPSTQPSSTQPSVTFRPIEGTKLR